MKIVNAVYRINTADMRDVNENIDEVIGKIGKYITEIYIHIILTKNIMKKKLELIMLLKI